MSDSLPPQYDTHNEVMWFISVTKENSWDMDRFLHEYQQVHANMVRKGHEVSKLPLGYVQFGASALAKQGNEKQQQEQHPGWDFLTCLLWPNTFTIWKGFQNPQYQETAGKHIFCRLDQQGLIARHVETVSPSAANHPSDGNFAVHVFHRREAHEDTATEDWIRERLSQARGWGRPLKIYTLWKDVTPRDTDTFFASTQFAGGSWLEFKAVERFVFDSYEEASAFLDENRTQITGNAKVSPYLIAGTSSLVV